MTFRSFIFWPHLVAGILAGAVIVVMSVTGVLLTYERQLITWSDSHYQSVVPAPGAARVGIAEVLASLSASHPDLAPTTVTVHAAPARPIAIAAGTRTFYADAYSGALLGESSTGVRKAMSELRAWHRWLAVEGEHRPVAKAVTGWSNLIFAFIVVSGLYLWLPRTWTWLQVRAVLLFNGKVRGKARDFNWHNVLGVWLCIPVFIVVISAVPISFSWANAAIYQALGEPVPAGRGGGAGRGGANLGGAAGVERSAGRERATGREAGTRREPDATASATLAGVDALLARAERQESGWRTIGVRIPPSPTAPVSFAVDRGDGGQPHLRSTLTLTRAGQVETYENFASQTPGRRIRSIARFAHTGEVLGITGQTIAGVATAATLVLAWTGVALSLRRLRAWIGRRQRRRPAASPQPAARSAA